MKLVAAAAAALVLAGCDSRAPAPAPSDAAILGDMNEIIVPEAAPMADNAVSAARVTLGGEGIALGYGAGQQLAFGMPHETATSAAAAGLGAPIEQGEEMCGAGPLAVAR